MTPRSSYQIVTQNSYKFDLEELLNNTNFDFLVGEDKELYFEDEDRPSSSKYVKIDEATGKEILRDADPARKKRSKFLSTYYQGVTNARGWIKFKTTSQYTKGKYYVQYIKLKEAKDMKYFKEFSKRDIIRLFLSGDLQVYCSCFDFRYRYKYLTYHKKFGLFKELRYPKIRNPHLEGSVCKHLICVLTYLSGNTMRIYKDMTKSKFFKKKAEIDDENTL